MKQFYRITIFLIICIGLSISSCTKGKEYRLYIGGFTRNDGEKGMSLYSFNTGDGSLKLISEADVGPSPSYFCYSAKNKLLYVSNEVMEFKGNFGGGVSTFKVNDIPAGFEKLNEMVIPYGGPCYISMSADSGFLFMANYPNGSVAVIKLDQNGIPSTITDTILYKKDEPDKSHAHMILSDPSRKHVYVTDLGLDRIVTYDFDTVNGKLKQVENGITILPNGSGPRHFVFSSDGTKLYVINELGSYIAVYNVDPEKGLIPLKNYSTTRATYDGQNYCADIHIDKDGKYLYGSNRGENSIVTYKIEADGLLSLAGHTSCGGDWPRNFTLDPSGKFLLIGNQKSNYVSVFKIDKKTGLPSVALDSIKVRMPACLKFF